MANRSTINYLPTVQVGNNEIMILHETYDTTLGKTVAIVIVNRRTFFGIEMQSNRKEQLMHQIGRPNLYIVLVPDQMPDFNTVTIQSNPSLQPHIQGINLQSVPPNIWNQISAVTGLTSFGNANFPFPANTGSTNGNFPFAANTAPTFGSIYPGAQFANPCLVSFGNPANTFGGPAPIANVPPVMCARVGNLPNPSLPSVPLSAVSRQQHQITPSRTMPTFNSSMRKLAPIAEIPKADVKRVTGSVDEARKDRSVNINKKPDEMKTHQPKNVDANKEGQTADDAKKKTKSRKRKMETTGNFTCSKSAKENNLVLRRIDSTASVNSNSTQSVNSNGILTTEPDMTVRSEADRLLDTAEKALKQSEESTKKQLGEANETVEDLLKDSNSLNQLLSTGKGAFDSDVFIDNIMAKLSSQDRQRLSKATNSKQSSTSPVKRLQSASCARPVNILERASASLITRFKSVYDNDAKADPRKNNVGDTGRSKGHYIFQKSPVAKENRKQPIVQGSHEVGLKSQVQNKENVYRKDNVMAIQQRLHTEMDSAEQSVHTKSLQGSSSDGHVQVQINAMKVKEDRERSPISRRPVAVALALNRISDTQTMSGNFEKKLPSEGMKVDNTGERKVSQHKVENFPLAIKIKKEKEAVVQKMRSEIRRPPPAHSTKNTFSMWSAIQVSPLDLSKGVTKIKKVPSSSPMYVDGANDTRSSRRSLSESSISSSILETEGDPTQPPSPPVEVSSSGSSDVPVIVIDDSDSSNGNNANPLAVRYTGEESTIDLADFSTVSASTHGTYDTRNLNNSTQDHTYAYGYSQNNESDNSGSDVNRHDLNGTCNVDLDAVMQGHSDDSPVCGSEAAFHREPTSLTIWDLMPETSYEDFERKLFVHSSPKRPAPKNVKRKSVFRDLGENDDDEDKRKKRCIEPLFGPVNNKKGWIKFRCREEEILPDLVEETKSGDTPEDPLLGNMSDNDHSLDDTRVQDPDDSLTSQTKPPETASESAMELIEKMRCRNLKMHATIAMQNGQSFYADTMTIPELIQSAMLHLHQQGYLSSYIRHLLRDPFTNDEIPEQSSNANILLKHFGDVLDGEIKRYLSDNNVHTDVINETRLQRFCIKVRNAVAWIIPSQHLEFDHINQKCTRIPQVETGLWSNHDFSCFVNLLKCLKINAKDKVLNHDAFWKFFASQLKTRGGVSRTPEDCADMEKKMITRFRAIRYNLSHKGRDRIIYDTMKQYPHLNPPVVASSTVGSELQDDRVDRVISTVTVARDKSGQFARQNDRSTFLNPVQGTANRNEQYTGLRQTPRQDRDDQNYTGIRSDPLGLNSDRPMAAGHGSGESAPSALWPSLENYVQNPRSAKEKIYDELHVISTNSGELTSSMKTFLTDFNSYINRPTSTAQQTRPPVPPSPQPKWHVCNFNCPMYCNKVFDD